MRQNEYMNRADYINFDSDAVVKYQGSTAVTLLVIFLVVLS